MGRPPNTVFADRTLRLPSATHAGHWCPTAASFMQSGQMGRPHRVQEMWVSRSGCR
ncbi:hypothetical protein GCM10027440_50600 [Nocardiopsis coralliicola]